MQKELTVVSNFLQKNPIELLNIEIIHGFLTACVISPNSISPQTIFDWLFTDEKINFISDIDKNQLTQDLTETLKVIDQQLNSDDHELIFPIDNTELMPNIEYEERLSDWCMGFTEAHLHNEKHWLSVNEQQVIELIFPILVISQVFNEEPEFQEFLDDENLYYNMMEQIPETVTELYLLLHSQNN